ncbi:MAG: sulfatase [Spirochaetaceae bacterium]|nr:sulfatase [Spirochaetaceae bacterium]
MRFRDDVNVLFILVDTLRADRLGVYGYDRATSPTLDYVARTGIRFTHHLAQSSWTKCSMASLWTGVYPPRTGVTRFDDAIPEEATMPAERLAEAGFRTAAIWRNGWVAPNFGFAQGFEVYERPAPGAVPLSVRREKPHVDLHGSDRDVVNSAKEFLRAHGHERFFLYLHLMDVHQYVYDEPSAKFGSSYSDVYDNSILYTDTSLGDLLTFLAERDLLQRSIVVIASDHGEAFSERGIEGHAKHVYRETTETPWIMSLPFRVEDGVEIPTRTRNVDIWPTLLDLLGLAPLENIDGRSVADEILSLLARREDIDPSEDRPGLSDPVAYSFLDRTWGQIRQPPKPAVAVVDGPLRYVYARSSDGRVTEQLFDRTTDPSEATDVLAEHPDRAADMRRQAESHLDAFEAPPWGDAAVSVEIDAMELNQLRALGYEIP